MKKIIFMMLFIPLAGCGDSADLIGKGADLISDVLSTKPSNNDIVKHLGSDNCLKEYEAYWDTASNKAFASAGDGSCGWSASNHETADAAKKEAIDTCEEYREEGTPCQVVDVNGRWQ
jgi:hypothetical protein